MKKNIFRLGLLACVGLFMTACSNDDDSLNDKLIPQPTKGVKVTLIGSVNSNITRSTIDASDGSAKWSAGDKIGIRYKDTSNQYVWAEGTIESSAEKSTFIATLTDPVSSNDVVLIYPYSCRNEAASVSPFYSTSSLTGNVQDGKLTTIGSNYNIQSVESVSMTVNGSSASLSAKLASQVSIVQFNVLDTDNSTALNASLLEITVGDASAPTYTIKPVSTMSTFYVAMVPTTSPVKVAATITGDNGALKLDTEAKVNMMTANDVGKFICVNTTDGNQAYLCDSKENNNNAKIDVHSYSSTNLVAGNFYTLQLKARNVTFTPRAVVAHVGAIKSAVENNTNVNAYCDKFLAIALEDAVTQVSNITNSYGTVSSWATNNSIKIVGDTYAFMNNASEPYDKVYDNVNNSDLGKWTTSASRTSTVDKGWRIPTVTDWRYIFYSLCKGRSYNTPAGIADQNGRYDNNEVYSPTEQLSGTYRIAINTACGNTNLQNQVYWTGSQLDATQEAEAQQKGNDTEKRGWRWDFSNGVFQWITISNGSLVRCVFAY